MFKKIKVAVDKKVGVFIDDIVLLLEGKIIINVLDKIIQKRSM